MSSICNYCLGCGSLLQYNDPNTIGYAKSVEQKYCQRCFRMMHYGEKKDQAANLDNRVNEIIKENENDTLFFFIIDAYETLVLYEEKYLDQFKNIPMVLIVNKIDLLPKNTSDEKINRVYTKVISKLKVIYPNIKDAFVTYKDDYSFTDMFFEYIKSLEYKKFCFIGRSNAGKSTLLNKIFGQDILITSKYVGSTLNNVDFEFNGYKFIDTPGLIDDDNILNYLANFELGAFVKYKTVNPMGFQVYEPQSFFMSGLFKVDINPYEMVSVIFESNRDDIHRTKLSNSENYFIKNKEFFQFRLYPWSQNEFLCEDKLILLIKGFGLIKIIGKANINISINDKIKIHKSEVDI